MLPQVRITANNVKWLQLFEDDQPDSAVMALHPPDDPSQGFKLHPQTLTQQVMFPSPYFDFVEGAVVDFQFRRRWSKKQLCLIL